MVNIIAPNLTEIAAQQANISDETIDAFKELRQLSTRYQRLNTEESLNELLAFTAKLDGATKLSVANLLAFDRISQSVKEVEELSRLKEKRDPRETSFRAKRPEDNFSKMFEELYAKVGRDKDKFVELISGVNKDFLDSKTRTSHPTIFDSNFMWNLHAELAHELENSGQSEDLLDKLSEAMQKVFTGEEDVTPMKQITVLEENEIDIHNLKILGEINNTVREKYNASLANFLNQIGVEPNEIENSKLDKEQFELRTWGFTFDADGRPRSTTLMLYKSLEELKKLDGVKGDLRQNASAHTLTLSAIIQARYRESKFGTGRFGEFCNEFVADLNETNEAWRNPNESPYIALNSHKGAFARKILGSDFQLVPDFVHASIIPVCEAFSDEFAKFLKENNLKENTTLEQLCTIRNPDKSARAEERYIYMIDKFRDVFKKRDIEITMPDGKIITKRFKIDSGLHFIPDDETRVGKWLKSTHRFADKDETELRENTHEERAILADSVKRLIFMGIALDKNPDICDRLQIANFESEAHFYETLLLMREAKLVEIKDGLVQSKPKIGIQPLLETVEDLDNAQKVFTELLKDPLVLSYYQQRGVAEFMFGFSDGAKSGGNLKSQLEIYKTSRKLTELFESHGIKTRFFLGRGPGADRGGMNEMGLSSSMLHDSYSKYAISDQTTQADQPLAQATRPKTEGEPQIASSVEHNIRKAALARLGEKELSAEKEQVIEESIDWIANRADELFQGFIRNNPETAKLMNDLRYNSDISSRPPKRGKGIPDYEDIRAIPVEYKPALVGLAIHNYGLKQALNEFAAGKGAAAEILEKLQEFGNKPALKTLMENEFFNNFMRVQERHLDNFDPLMAKAILRVNDDPSSERNQYLLQVIDGTTGLKDTLSFMTGNFHKGHSRLNPVTESGVNRVAAQAIIASLPAETDTNLAQHGENAKILRISESVSAAGFRDSAELIKENSLARAA